MSDRTWRECHCCGQRIYNQSGKEIDPDRAVCDAAKLFGVSVEELTGYSRKEPVVHYRHLTAFFLHELAGIPLKRVGQALGGKDHTTMINSIATAEVLLRTRKDFRGKMRVMRGWIS